MKTLLLLALTASLCACASTTSLHSAIGDASPAVEPTRAVLDDAPSESSARVPDLDPLSLANELQAPGMTDMHRRSLPRSEDGPRWPRGRTLMQGFLGAYEFDTIERSGGSTEPVDGSDDSLSQLPAIGGGGQWKLAGDRIDLGLEAMLSFGWRANAVAFAAGGGGAVVAVDVDLFLIDLYGGPFLSMFLGDHFRVYGAAGPMLQWANYDQDSEGAIDDGGGSGFGTGWYARTGLEYVVRPGLMIGGGVRWIDSTINLDGGLGDLDLEGLQWAFTVSTGI